MHFYMRLHTWGNSFNIVFTGAELSSMYVYVNLREGAAASILFAVAELLKATTMHFFYMTLHT